MSESCSFCSYVFVDVHILCMNCDPKVPICIRCFSKGLESLTHKNDHEYSVVTTEFPLLCKTWTAAEELKLLDALLECGVGNWTDIAKHVCSKTAKECKSHYLQYYIYAPQDLLKGIAPEPSYVDSCQLAPVPYRVSGDPPRPVLSSQQHVDMAGYMAARGDFVHEFDNFAEMDVAELDFSQCEDDLDKELQLAMVSIYQDRLRERARRKWLVRKHGLVHPQKTRQSWRRYSTTLGEATTALLGRLMQLLPPNDFEFLCEGLHSEQLLCQQVQLLQESRRAGLTRLDSIALFKQCRRWRVTHRPKHTAFTELLAHIKNETSTQVWLHKQLVKDASLSPLSPKGLGRRTAPPLAIEGMPGYEKLNTQERELCAGLRIVPEMYLHFKGLLVNEYEKLGSLRLANARAIIKIDVNKTRKLYDFLLAEGIVKKDVH
ncbi:transcriptional adapter 2-alpha isoform X1 [Dermacentor andersoni]|uniref:transcriptional adapter 2-alpha isoform X1 n=2 Tax=Dermacentor andersoni TaxID=34620 RepID=UPI0021555FB9|nr:transcriptional adapter 2-alpha-like isoform X1 [Dermacentor andersoni]